MVRWMESQGYDMTYVTDTELETNPNLLLGHRVFVNTGHDEYYSDGMKSALQNGVNNGVNLALFSANNAVGRVTWSADGSGSALTAHPYEQGLVERRHGVVPRPDAAATGERPARRHDRGRRFGAPVPRVQREQLDLRGHGTRQLHRQRARPVSSPAAPGRTPCRASSGTSSTRGPPTTRRSRSTGRTSPPGFSRSDTRSFRRRITASTRGRTPRCTRLPAAGRCSRQGRSSGRSRSTTATTPASATATTTLRTRSVRRSRRTS